jgi:hypothetical protein
LEESVAKRSLFLFPGIGSMNVPRSEPDFRLTNFSLWVDDWEVPPERERWDDNWLNVTAYHESTFGSFVTGGAIVQSGTI